MCPDVPLPRGSPRASAPPEVSIIIPSFNGALRLPRCLDALVAQETRRAYEILVVDDGSTDQTSAVAASYAPAVIALRQDNAGPGAARNLGARRARGSVLLFTDDDCIAERDWLERMLAPFSDPSVAAAKGSYRTRQRQWVARFVQLEYEEKYDELARHPSIDFVDTYSAAFRRNVFLDAGGFDASFTTASTEDQELSFRLAEAGYEMRFVRDARAWHTHAASLRAYLRKKFKIGYWKVLVLIKHPAKMRGDSHTPLTLKLQVALAAALLPSLVVLIAGPVGLVLPAAILAALGLSTIPLTLRCLRRDPRLAIVAPLIIAGRAAALAAGLACGALARALGAMTRRSR